MHRHPDLPRAFAELGLDIPLLRGLVDVKYVDPSPIQREVVPQVLAGRDVLGQARTGTGKTAAFGMPILQLIDPQGQLQAMILTPTRELAAQVVGELRRLAKYLDLRCVPVYGGTRIKEQIHQLGRRPHVAVGTPGRVIDMMDRGVLRVDALRFVVLDEVDRMLDIGFRDDIRKILGRIKQPHQTVFVSATIDDEIKRLAMQFMNDPIEVNVSRDELTVEEVDQRYCAVDPWDKFRLLRRVLEVEKPRLAIVFCNTKHGARKLARRLHDAGINAKDIHGDLIQQKRERIMERFRRHQIPVLVATDLAARGIDVQQITHIINYDLPEDPEVYVHRIGRTARMGASGRAISLALRDQGPLLTKIEMLINKEVARIEIEGFEASPAPPQDSAEPRARPRSRSAYVPPVSKPAAPAAAATPSVSRLGGKYPVTRRRRR